jgi:hypothetical protein
LPRIQRRRRIRCRLPCEIVERRRSVRARVVSLSEGGLGIETGQRADVGESLRLRILPRQRDRTVSVEGIAWNDQPARSAVHGGGLRLVGVVLSDPPAAFLKLLDELERRSEPAAARRERARPRPAAPASENETSRPRAAGAAAEPETNLPRSRAPLPPPKPEPEESLPVFRVRLKQVGGPRTRVVAVRAHSVAEATERAREELERAASLGATAWEVLGAFGA